MRFFSQTVQKDLGDQIKEALIIAALPPQKRQAKALPRWTLKRFVQWLKEKWKINCCRETVRKTLKKMGFSWKKAKKLLNKASRDAVASPVVVRRRSGHSPCAKREDFVVKITKLLDDALHQRQLLIYIDEAHIHLDTDEGYGWSIKGERFWISSSSPGRKKVSFCGVYIYNQGTTRIFPYELAEKMNTIDVLKKLRVEFPEQKITIVWDGAPYHRARLVKQAASTLDINLEPLPGAEAKPLSRTDAKHPARQGVLREALSTTAPSPSFGLCPEGRTGRSPARYVQTSYLLSIYGNG